MEQLVARRAHNPKVVRSSRAPATKKKSAVTKVTALFLFPSTLALQLTLYYDALFLAWVWKVRAKKIAKRSELFLFPSTLSLQLTLYYDALFLAWVWKVRAKKIAKWSDLFLFTLSLQLTLYYDSAFSFSLNPRSRSRSPSHSCICAFLSVLERSAIAEIRF